jgi:hypothetical protein
MQISTRSEKPLSLSILLSPCHWGAQCIIIDYAWWGLACRLDSPLLPGIKVTPFPGHWRFSSVSITPSQFILLCSINSSLKAGLWEHSWTLQLAEYFIPYFAHPYSSPPNYSFVFHNGLPCIVSICSSYPSPTAYAWSSSRGHSASSHRRIIWVTWI